MKAFFINTVCGVGSTGKIIADLMDLLRQRGDEVKVAYGFGEDQSVQAEEAYKMTSQAGYYLHNALSRLTDKAGLYSRRETEELIRQIERFDPDIIHLHNLHGYYLNYEVLFRYLSESRRKVVWTLHDCWAFTGHCTHFHASGCEQWKNGCKKCSQLKEYPKCYFWGNVRDNFARKKTAFTAPSAMTVVTPSVWLKKLVEQSFLNCHPVRSIPNGIDTAVFRPVPSDFREKRGLQGKKILLGVAGTWGERKGLGDLCQLASRLPEDCKIVLVGVSEAQKRTLPEEILALPRTENASALAEIYSAADVFLNPTYEDTYPTVNLEAQACGTPVVSYDVGGCAQTVAQGLGVTVPCGDLDDLENTALQLAHQPPAVDMEELRRRLDKTACYAKYLELYDQMAKKG